MITPKTLKLIENDIATSFAAIGKKHGVHIKFGSGSYSATNATVKLEIATIAASGEVITKEASAFKNYAKSYGLDPSDFGKKFTTGSDTYEICGLKTKAYKMPILGKRADGKIFKFNELAVKHGLELYQKLHGPKPTTTTKVQTPAEQLSGMGTFKDNGPICPDNDPISSGPIENADLSPDDDENDDWKGPLHALEK